MCMMTIAAKSYGFKNYVRVWAATAHTLNVSCHVKKHASNLLYDLLLDVLEAI